MVLLATCWFCKGCALHRLRKRREKHRLLSTSASLDLPPVTSVTNEGFVDDDGGTAAIAIVATKEQKEDPPPSYRSATKDDRRTSRDRSRRSGKFAE